MTFRRWFSLAGLLFGAVIFDGCSSDADSGSVSPCAGGRCEGGVPIDAAPDHTLDVGALDQQPPNDADAHNPLCGQGCNPDDPMACPDSAALGEDGGDAAPDSANDAGFDASFPPDASPGDAGVRPDSGVNEQACQVRRAGTGRAASCSPAGMGLKNAPCISSADCRPGLACVGDAEAALCRPYCCGGSEGRVDPGQDSGTQPCPVGDYCAERSLRDDADGAEPLRVPVCVPAEKCLLSDPYPCPPGGACTCPEGTACTVVRNDGTTGCVEPGSGVQGEACPCAAGHLCSRGTNRCLKLCATSSLEPDCGNGVCQSVTGWPPGWGGCVGLVGDGG